MTAAGVIHHRHRGHTDPAQRLHDIGALAGRAGQFAQHAVSTLAAAAPWIAAGTFAVLLTVSFARRWRAHHGARNARLIRVGVPPQADPAAAQLLWSALHDLLRPRWARLLSGQPHVAWEILAGDAGTTFAIWAPATIPPGLIERAISAAWPGTTLTIEEPAPAPMPPTPARTAAELALAGPEWFSLATGDGPDPLALVLGQLAGLRAGEHAVVQVIARPASGRSQARLTATARRLQAGIPTSRAGRLLDLVGPGRAPQPIVDPTRSTDVRLVLEKASHPLFHVVVRTAVGAGSRGAARGRIHALNGAFAAYQGRARLRRHRLHRPDGKLARRLPGRRARLMSMPELVALAHLPADQGIPGVVRAGARAVSPPPGGAVEGKQLGVDRDGEPVLLGVADARHHVHLLGPTGVGKSTLIARLVLEDFAAGRGAVVIDPAGDLVDDLLARIPEGEEGRVDLFDPLDPAPPGLNVLDGADQSLVVDQVVGIFARVFERYWGPRTEDVLRSCLSTLARSEEQATLVDVPRLLTDPEWRKPLVDELDDPVALDTFWEGYDRLAAGAQMQTIAPLLNKLRALLLRLPVRAIIGQPRSTIDIGRCLDQGRLLLVRLPKGTLGEDTSQLLGSLIVARVWQAALARAARDPQQRPDCGLYVDEVHNYMTLPTPLGDMLAEARKYRLSLCLAHQHLGQLRRELRDGLANARTKVYFQLAPEDAAALRHEVQPELDAYDLEHLPAHTAAARVCTEGQATAAFTLATTPLPPGAVERAEQVRAASRARIGTPREQVEGFLTERYGPPA